MERQRSVIADLPADYVQAEAARDQDDTALDRPENPCERRPYTSWGCIEQDRRGL